MLFQLLARRLPKTDAKASKRLVKAGAVYMGHLRIRVPSTRVAAGERITVYPEALEHDELPREMVKIVHRDPAFVILDKPPGVPVAATKDSARGTLSEALRRVLHDEGMTRPYVGVVHRLDRGASGLVLFTIRDIANQSLHRQFVEHRIERIYRVLLRGEAPANLECDAPLVEKPSGGMQVAEQGQPRAKSARTIMTRIDAAESRQGTSLMQVQLHTGRTHQIRVHAAHLGYPVMGDHRYGREPTHDEQAPDRLYLHAHHLSFEHPLQGTPVDVHSDLPAWARTKT